MAEGKKWRGRKQAQERINGERKGEGGRYVLIVEIKEEVKDKEEVEKRSEVRMTVTGRD